MKIWARYLVFIPGLLVANVAAGQDQELAREARKQGITAPFAFPSV